MRNPKPFLVTFTSPRAGGRFSYRFATFEEVQKAAQAWEPQAVAQSNGAIVAEGGKQIGKYVKDQN